MSTIDSKHLWPIHDKNIIVESSGLVANIYYKEKNKKTLLATKLRPYEMEENGRVDASHESEILQTSVLKMEKGKTFKPHVHLMTEKITTGTQESWIVITGQVKAKLYYNDKRVIDVYFGTGECLISYRCGHTFEILEDDTIVVETKTGPYLGQKLDKRFIE